jgi:GTPase
VSPDQPSAGPTRSGFVAVIGAPNAGKSTLINKLVGGKVTIVSRKVQTTRSIVRGICIHKNAQIVFVDTPGLFTPKKRLERAMVAAAWSGREDADMAVLIVDVANKRIDRDTYNIIDRLKELEGKHTCVLALNKIDGLKVDKLLPLARDLNERFDFAATFMISALRGDGTQDMLDWLGKRLPEGPYLYPEDQINDMPSRLLAAEITREKLFRRLFDEIPYALTVETESWEEHKDGSVAISQIIYVARESHRPIILGKGGHLIRDIGEEARKEFEEITGVKTHLKLFVKVSEKWAEDPEHYRLWGLDYKA